MARGRKSAAGAAVAMVGERSERLPAPPELSDAERQVWTATVAVMPAGWFNVGHAPMLHAYCGHVVRGRIVDQQLDAFDPEWMSSDEGVARYEKLLNMREKQTRAAAALARAMRLTQQSSYHPETAGLAVAKAGGKAKPWQG